MDERMKLVLAILVSLGVGLCFGAAMSQTECPKWLISLTCFMIGWYMPDLILKFLKDK